MTFGFFRQRSSRQSPLKIDAIHYPLSVIIPTAINKRKLKIQSDTHFHRALYFILMTFHKFTIISVYYEGRGKRGKVEKCRKIITAGRVARFNIVTRTITRCYSPQNLDSAFVREHDEGEEPLLFPVGCSRHQFVQIQASSTPTAEEMHAQPSSLRALPPRYMPPIIPSAFPSTGCVPSPSIEIENSRMEETISSPNTSTRPP